MQTENIFIYLKYTGLLVINFQTLIDECTSYICMQNHTEPDIDSISDCWSVALWYCVQTAERVEIRDSVFTEQYNT